MRNIEGDFFSGFIRLHILHHAAEEPIYGVAMITELGTHGYQLSPGTMYPLLHNMERAGYLRSSHKLCNGRLRRYYRITAAGRKILKSARLKMHELIREVL